MGKIKLIDYLTINPDPAFGKLTSKDKVKLIDSLLGQERDKNGLEIIYDLSHSGRRINNRIYTVKGQQDGINTLVTPYPKPILTHHDGDSDPIGRFIDGQWEDLSNYALPFFSDVSEFMELKKAYDLDDPERIYKVMKKHNLLTNKDWPGIGRMRVRARITDEKAVEKFLDGRYITFSAGSTTDRHVCSICLSDWADGDLCEHRHGKIYDGDICVFITGKFEVLEGSVVNLPADDLSQVLSMELTDHNGQETNSKCIIDKNTMYISDSIYNVMEKNMSEHVMEVAPEVTKEHVSVEISSDEDSVVQSEASELVSESATVETLPKEGKDSAESADLKDELDAETTDSIEVTEDKSKTSVSNSLDQLDSLVKKLGEIINKAASAKEVTKVAIEGDSLDEEKIQETKTEAEDKEEEDKKEGQACDGTGEQGVHKLSDESDFVTDESLDWYLLEAGLFAELGDEKLSKEQREELPASSFCGPERSFPVPDCAHATAAKRLISRVKLSSDQKVKVLACVNRKVEKLECGATNDYTELESAYQALKQDHVVILQKVEELEGKLRSMLNSATVNKSDEAETSSNDAKANAEAEQKGLREKRIENPSVVSTDITDPLDRKKLGKYEQSIVDRYEQLLTTRGSDAADRYYVSTKRYLPRGFHPNNYIGE